MEARLLATRSGAGRGGTPVSLLDCCSRGLPRVAGLLQGRASAFLRGVGRVARWTRPFAARSSGGITTIGYKINTVRAPSFRRTWASARHRGRGDVHACNSTLSLVGNRPGSAAEWVRAWSSPDRHRVPHTVCRLPLSGVIHPSIPSVLLRVAPLPVGALPVPAACAAPCVPAVRPSCPPPLVLHVV